MSTGLQIHQIPDFLARYNGDHDGEDDDLIARSERIRRERKMQLADLCAVCNWKALRAAGHARKNTNTEVEEITALALAPTRFSISARCGPCVSRSRRNTRSTFGGVTSASVGRCLHEHGGVSLS
jgi:hypothetical protein